MKRIIVLLLTLSLLLAMLAGCGKGPAPAVTPDPVPGDTTQTTGTPEVPTEPEVPLVLVEPEWTEPVYNIENTLENRQKALTAVGLAYAYKGLLNQYGLQDLNVIDEFSGGGLRGNTLERNSPEENTKDLTLYQWCSSFVYDVVYHALGYKINGSYVDCRTDRLSSGNLLDKDILVAHQYNLTGSEAVDTPVIDAIIADLQPGDIVTYTQASGAGHSLLVTNDYTGDGELDVLHRSGSRYDMATGMDQEEGIGIARGNLKMFQAGDNGLYNKARISVVRVTNLDPTVAGLTNSAKARLTYPGLRIDRTVEGGVLASVEPGGTLTYNIAITNNSEQDHVAMPVMDQLDPHCTMLTQDGKTATTTYPVWSVDVKAGETVNLTYTVKVEGKPGDVIVSKGGSVAGIPSNQLTTTIQAFTPEASKLQDQAKVDAAAAASASAAEFVNKLYEAAYGVNPGLGTVEEVRTAILDAQQRVTMTLYYPKEDMASSAPGNMLVPTYIGGQNTITTVNERILETRMEDLQPGDIIIGNGTKMGKPMEYYWIYNGEKLLDWNGGKVKELKQKDLTKLLSFEFFACFRPSLAGE